jgi:hypothetical protein
MYSFTLGSSTTVDEEGRIMGCCDTGCCDAADCQTLPDGTCVPGCC